MAGLRRRGGEEMDKLEKWMTGKEKLTDIEIFKEALSRWQKIGQHFIDKGLAVWGDIMPLKSLEIIKGYEKRIAELEQAIKILKESGEK